MTADQRRSVENGIWLCQNCARLIDVDGARFSTNVLRRWRYEAERTAQAELAGLADALRRGEGWIWHAETHAYVSREDGTIVGPREIVSIRDSVLAKSAARVERLASRVLRGTLPLEQWWALMIRELKYVYLASYALGHGGWVSVDDDARTLLSAQLRSQLPFLRQIERDVASGEYSVGSKRTRCADLQRRASDLVFSVCETLDWP